MKPLHFIALVLLAVVARGAGFDVEAHLRATVVVEGWRGVDGAAGEKGPLQFTPATWRQHMGAEPFAHADRLDRALVCGRRHVAWLHGEFALRGVDPSHYNTALAWNAGLTAVVRGRAPLRAYDYANRLANVINGFSTTDRHR